MVAWQRLRIATATIVGIFLWLGCASDPTSTASGGRAPGSSATPAETARDTGSALDAEVRQLEAARDRSRRSARTRDQLGDAYYRRARWAFDQGDEIGYQRDLALAMDEWIESLRIEPSSPSPHTMMGAVAAYQGDLDRALRSFSNARKLEPRAWVAYTNIAEVMIYRGSEKDARKWLRRGEERRADPAIIELNLALATWREGRVDWAKEHLADAQRLNPRVLDEWNMAPVPYPIRNFDDFARNCCNSPACGPYMANACVEVEQEVRQREAQAETVRQELIVEMERRKKLREIYDRRRDLEVEIESDDPSETP